MEEEAEGKGEEIEKQVGNDQRPVQSSLWTDTDRTDQKLVSPALASRIINVGTWIAPLEHPLLPPLSDASSCLRYYAIYGLPPCRNKARLKQSYLPFLPSSLFLSSRFYAKTGESVAIGIARLEPRGKYRCFDRSWR